MNTWWLVVGTFMLALGMATNSLLPILAGLAVCGIAWVKHKAFVLRLLKSGQTISDNGKGAFTLTAFDDAVWLAHFSEEWVAQYGTTWAFGKGRTHVWWFTPKGDDNGER